MARGAQSASGATPSSPVPPDSPAYRDAGEGAMLVNVGRGKHVVEEDRCWARRGRRFPLSKLPPRGRRCLSRSCLRSAAIATLHLAARSIGQPAFRHGT